ncbi:class III bacteriocin, partial [Lactobacillus delbrueckii subsp. sunkii]|nr:class III bacteriocin [Lactobacillus delbrueckii subsp. sunkii]
GKVHQSIHFSPSKVHARGIIAITSSLIEYLLAKLLSFQGFIVIFGVGSLSELENLHHVVVQVAYVDGESVYAL